MSAAFLVSAGRLPTKLSTVKEGFTRELGFLFGKEVQRKPQDVCQWF